MILSRPRSWSRKRARARDDEGDKTKRSTLELRAKHSRASCGGTRTCNLSVQIGVVLSAFVAGPDPLAISFTVMAIPGHCASSTSNTFQGMRPEARDDNFGQDMFNALSAELRIGSLSRADAAGFEPATLVVMPAFVTGLGPRAVLPLHSIHPTSDGPKRREFARSDPACARCGTRTRTPFGLPMESRMHSLRADERRSTPDSLSAMGPSQRVTREGSETTRVHREHALDRCTPDFIRPGTCTRGRARVPRRSESPTR